MKLYVSESQIRCAGFSGICLTLADCNQLNTSLLTFSLIIHRRTSGGREKSEQSSPGLFWATVDTCNMAYCVEEYLLQLKTKANSIIIKTTIFSFR